MERLRNGGVPRNPVFLMPATHCSSKQLGQLSAVWPSPRLVSAAAAAARSHHGGHDGQARRRRAERPDRAVVEPAGRRGRAAAATGPPASRPSRHSTRSDDLAAKCARAFIAVVAVLAWHAARKRAAIAYLSMSARPCPPSGRAVFRSHSHQSRCSFLLLCTIWPRSSRITTRPAHVWHSARQRAGRPGIPIGRAPEIWSPWRRASRVALLIPSFSQCPSQPPSRHASKHYVYARTDACSRTCAAACVSTRARSVGRGHRSLHR